MTLILTQTEVRELLPMDACVDLMHAAFGSLSSGGALNPLRTMVWLPDRSALLGLMPGYLPSPPALGVKVIGVAPGNHGTQLDSHQGVVMLFSEKTGELQAIMQASEITAIRTAAASGAATRMLAREDAGDLAILGSGVQARTHLAAMAVVRKLRRVRVYSLSPDNAAAFAERESRRYDVAVEVVGSEREAVEGADLVCAVTSASEPVVRGEWLAPGAHINAAGACFPTSRELDTDAVARARVFVDCRESALNEAGDVLIPMQEGAFGEDHIVGEMGDVVLERVEGRRSAEEITLFKSLGVAVEDLASARYVYAQARERGIGTEVDLIGLKDDAQ